MSTLDLDPTQEDASIGEAVQGPETTVNRPTPVTEKSRFAEMCIVETREDLARALVEREDWLL